MTDQVAPRAPRNRLRGALLLLAAAVALVFAAVGLSEVCLAGQRNLHRGLITSSGYQVLRLRNGAGAYTTSDTPIVRLRLDDGTTHTVESTPLFNLFNRTQRALPVKVQLDSYGVPKRVRYQGRWYGAGPPVWFWLAFGLVLLSVGGLLGRGGIRLLRRPHSAAASQIEQAVA